MNAEELGALVLDDLQYKCAKHFSHDMYLLCSLISVQASHLLL